MWLDPLSRSEGSMCKQAEVVATWRPGEVTDSFAEYHEVSVTDPLRQGDVLEAADPDTSKWQRHLLVITADCDFAHDKHLGRVTCVPLLRAEEYLLELQVPRMREKYVRTKILPALRTVLAAVGAPNISDDRLRAWPLEAEAPSIVADLGLSGKDADVATAAFAALHFLGQPCVTLDEAVSNLVSVQLTGPQPQKRENITKAIAEALKAPYAQPPGDALFVSAVGPGQDSGFFAYLRHLELVWQDEIALGPTRGEHRYRRIAHLYDRYTHAMVQRFALVFMSIGLPREYEEIRDLHSELMGETYL